MTWSECTTPTMRPWASTDRQRVQVVFIEDLRHFGLVHVSGTRPDAGLGENGKMARRLSHDHARQRNGAAQDAFGVEEIDLGHGLHIAVVFA